MTSVLSSDGVLEEFGTEYALDGQYVVDSDLLRPHIHTSFRWRDVCTVSFTVRFVLQAIRSYLQ